MQRHKGFAGIEILAKLLMIWFYEIPVNLR
jgi:hypothetical protein